MTEGVLVPSSNRGRYAISRPDGVDLTSGARIEVWLGDQWIAGTVEHGRDTYVVETRTHEPPKVGYYFWSDDDAVCGLCVGMKVRLP